MFVSREDYLSLPRSPEAWVIEDLLPVSGSLNIYGDPKCGKSSLALQMADAIGEPAEADFLGHAVKTHGNVAYLQVDTPRGMWCKQIIEHYLPSGRTLNSVYFADKAMAPYPFNILERESQEWLRAAVDSINAVTVIIDTLRETYSGDENDSGHMKEVIGAFYQATFPAAMVFLSHAKKRQANFERDLMGGSRGSGFLSGRMDTVMDVQKHHLVYQSRTAGETRIPIIRTPVLFERADGDDVAIQACLAAHPTWGFAAVCRALAGKTSLSPDALRTRVRVLMAEPENEK